MSVGILLHFYEEFKSKVGTLINYFIPTDSPVKNRDSRNYEQYIIQTLCWKSNIAVVV